MKPFHQIDGIQTEDLQIARGFYGDRLGLPGIPQTPEVVVFDSKPIPFAVRKRKRENGRVPGRGVAGC